MSSDNRRNISTTLSLSTTFLINDPLSYNQVNALTNIFGRKWPKSAKTGFGKAEFVVFITHVYLKIIAFGTRKSTVSNIYR